MIGPFIYLLFRSVVARVGAGAVYTPPLRRPGEGCLERWSNQRKITRIDFVARASWVEKAQTQQALITSLYAPASTSEAFNQPIPTAAAALSRNPPKTRARESPYRDRCQYRVAVSYAARRPELASERPRRSRPRERGSSAQPSCLVDCWPPCEFYDS